MEKISAEHFGRFLCPYNLGSRGDTLYYMIRRTDFERNAYRSDLYSLRDGVQRQLTDTGNVQAYYLLDDCIVYTVRTPSEPGGGQEYPSTAICAVKYGEQRARQIASIDLDVRALHFFSTDKFLFTGVYSFAYAKAFAASGSNREEAVRMMREGAECLVFDELPYLRDGDGVVNKTRTRLYSCSAGLIKPLTDELTSVSLTALSPDRKTLVFSAVRYTDRCPVQEKLFKLDVASGRIEELHVFDEPVSFRRIDFLFKDDVILCCSRHDRHGLEQNPDVVRYNLSNAYRRNIYTGGEHNMSGSINTDVSAARTLPAPTLVYGTNYFFISTIDDSAHLMKLDLTAGTISSLTFRKGAVGEAVLYEGGFAMTAMRGLHGCEIYKVGVDGKETLFRALNSACDDTASTQPEDLFFENENGVRVHGFVLPPQGRLAGKKAPAVLYVHGGPKTAFGAVYYHELQFLSQRGYAVLYCNPTGSEGRGNEFADLRGKYGGVDYRDLMTFVDRALARYDWIDPDRLGIAGGSYGGFMTNWVIGQTDRFRAACSQRSISNWISYLAASDIGYFFVPDQIGATPWTNIGALWDMSPLKYADRVHTPTLFLQSGEDYRCPVSEGVQMFTALRMRGVPARMCVFGGEDHDLPRSGSPRSRVRRLREIIDWFDRYLAPIPQ